MTASTLSSPPQVPTVAQLTARIKESLEPQFQGVWVCGEISNLARPHSGHSYFTLKDEQAQLRAVVWRTLAERIRFSLDDGVEVICQGDLEIYPPRGSYQLIVRRIEPRGIGPLELALRKLRERFQAEGLFDPARKRPLPPFPRRVAIVTSPTGAAIHDFLQVLDRRWRGTDVLVIPSRVQGAGAADEIAAGVSLANRLPLPIDVLVVARGGGSLEDLWAFNEEPVVRAIHASRIPVISAVGHEIDVTLSDLVADVRALTPSEAAERLVPDQLELRERLGQLQSRLTQGLRGRALVARRQLSALAQRPVLRRPYDQLHQRAQQLDELAQRAARGVRRQWERASERWQRGAARLEALSPLAVLARGYSVTTLLTGEVLREAGQVEIDQPIETRLPQGRLISRVVERHVE